MRKYIFAAALGLGTVATGATAAATLAGAQTATPAPATSVAPGQTNQGCTKANTPQMPADRPDPGTRIKADLKPLVDDGTLTQAQADKVAATLQQALWAHPGAPPVFHHKAE